MNEIKMHAVIADGILRLLEEKMQDREINIENANDRIELLNARIEIQKLLRAAEIVSHNN